MTQNTNPLIIDVEAASAHMPSGPGRTSVEQLETALEALSAVGIKVVPANEGWRIVKLSDELLMEGQFPTGLYAILDEASTT